MPDFLGQISGFVLYEDPLVKCNAYVFYLFIQKTCKNYPHLDIKEATLYKSQHISDHFFKQAT